MDVDSDNFESPWDEDPNITREAEWTKISYDFTNAGYREGITSGKESALQEGFDDGFARIGAPLGRELGLLRGFASALVSVLASQNSPSVELAREISSQLTSIRLSDIAPRDVEAENHAREHLEAEAHPNADLMGLEEGEEAVQKRRMEGVEDMLAQLSAGSASSGSGRPTVQDVQVLKARLHALSVEVGLSLKVD